MTATDLTDSSLRLGQALAEVLGLRPASNVGELIAAGQARYWHKPRLTVASHFDIEPEYIIFDAVLGTLGVVEAVTLPTTAGLDEKTLRAAIADQVKKHVDRATYLRHLLLRENRGGAMQPLTVELVLLTQASLPNGGQGEDMLQYIGEAIRGVSRDTDCLFHLGIGILACEAHPGEPSGPQWQESWQRGLRRAFPWLLTASRALSTGDAAPGAQKPPRRVAKLKLTNYRVAGRRVIAFADARLHLMHGANGSGKSSIAEAFELLTTGKIERLRQAAEADHAKVIANALVKRPATISVEWLVPSGEPAISPQEHEVVKDGLEKPLDREIPAGSFRLDQPLMDRLVGSSAQVRAQVFASAFFPRSVGSLSAYDEASKKHAEAMTKLGRTVERLALARKTLVDLQGWKGGAVERTSEAFPTLLNRWLERTAFIDLVQRVRSVNQTIKNAEANGWQADPAASQARAALSSGLGDERFEQFESEARADVDKLQAQLASFSVSPSTTTPHTDATTPTLSVTMVDALDAVSSFLFDPTTLAFGTLGHKLRAVLQAGDPPTYGPSTVIGAEKWTEAIIKDIDACLAACDTLSREQPTTTAWPGKAPCSEYDEALKTHAQRAELGALLSREFLRQLQPEAGQGAFDGSLVAALNELLALFTPARWGYGDIEIPSTLGNGTAEVPLLVHDKRAELHLNTAELNLFTVALFILCAGRVKKPLNLLIFDDPLQNLDELTCTAVARGIAEIARLWAHLGRPEQLLFLFHGEGDLQRFQAEVAGAVYRLPWLSPSHRATEDEIKSSGVTFDVRAVQMLTPRFLQEQPALPATSAPAPAPPPAGG